MLPRRIEKACQTQIGRRDWNPVYRLISNEISTVTFPSQEGTRVCMRRVSRCLRLPWRKLGRPRKMQLKAAVGSTFEIRRSESVEKQPNRVGWKRGQSDITLHARDGGVRRLSSVGSITRQSLPTHYRTRPRDELFDTGCNVPNISTPCRVPRWDSRSLNHEFDWKISFHRCRRIKISPDIFRRRELIVKVDCRFVFWWNKNLGDLISTGCSWDIFERWNIIEKRDRGGKIYRMDFWGERNNI